MKILFFDLETTGVLVNKNGIHQISGCNALDVMVLTTPYLAEKRSQMENFKQGTVAKTLGIEVDDSKLHDAMYDINICMAIYNIVCNQ